ncbi:MAG TPA: iron-containing redox enzyme family protein [candidate division Zixibacteria bacterium]|nr:iron-containing redox enzyme family protein [candidate division Zixibacteria bacterium]
MAASFHDQLVATRDRRHSKNHPFFELWAQGKLTREQTALYCQQHYHFVSEYLNWMAYEASQIPHRDVKAYLLENLGDEENPEDRHLDMLKDYVAASGLERDSVETAPVLPGTEGLQNWGWRMVYQRPWQAAVAGMFIGLESQFLDICRKLVPALHRHYGYAPRAREIRFFEEHIHADEIHGAKGFAIVEKYCDTRELQALALEAVEQATIRRWRYMNSIYWYALHGKQDDTPTL